MLFYYLTLLLIPFATHPLLGYNFHGITPIKFAGGVTLFLALLQRDSEAVIATTSRAKLYFGLLVSCLLIAMAIHSATINGERVLWFVSILMFYVTTVRLVNSCHKLLASCVALVLSMDLASAYMLKEYLQFRSHFPNFRPNGTFGDCNYFAASALAVLPIAWIVGRRAPSKMLSWFCLGSVAVILGGLIVSQSRGGMIGMAAIVLGAVYEAKSRARAIACLCAAAVLFLLVSPVNPILRFLEPDTAAKGSTDIHVELINAGLRMIRDYPLLGVGMGRFKEQSVVYAENLPKPYMAHNSFLEIAADNGVPALVFYLLMCGAVLRDVATAKTFHRNDSLTEGVLVGMRLGLVGYLLAAAFISSEYEKMPWVLCFLVMAMVRVAPQFDDADEFDEFDDEDFEQQQFHSVCPVFVS